MSSHLQNRSRSPIKLTSKSLSSRCPSVTHSQTPSFLTPRKGLSNLLKGINMTITKPKPNPALNTMDETPTPNSTNKNHHPDTPITKNTYLNSTKQLFAQNLQFSPLQARFTPSRNKSLPTFNFDSPYFNYDSNYQRSGFSNLSKPYNNLTSSPAFKYQSSTVKSIHINSFTPTSNSSNKNLVTIQKPMSPISPFPLKFEQTNSKIKNSPTFESVFKQVELNCDPRVKECKVSEIFIAQTPKKATPFKEGNALKNLRRRLTQNGCEEGPSTVSSKGKFESDNKRDLDFSLNIEPSLKHLRLETAPDFLENTERLSFERKNIAHQSISRSRRQKDEFFNLTPKESQELDLEVFELTESNSKQRMEKSEEKFSKTIEAKHADETLFVKPVKRKLSMKGEEDAQTEELKESFIIEQVLNSLNKNSKKAKQIKKMNLELIRKCSSNLCLVKEKETNGLFGLIKLENCKQKFIVSEDAEFQEKCLRRYCQYGTFVIVEPFEYTLEEIYSMKLVDERSIEELVRKFHGVLNEVKRKEKGRIDLKKLKERIVYTHGEFKLILIVERN